MSPPGGSAATRSGGTTSAEAAIKAAHLHLANSGVVMSSSKVSRLVRRFKARVERNGMTFHEFLVNAADMDPIAAARVDRERGQR
jgi:hypothetical protein